MVKRATTMAATFVLVAFSLMMESTDARVASALPDPVKAGVAGRVKAFAVTAYIPVS